MAEFRGVHGDKVLERRGDSVFDNFGNHLYEIRGNLIFDTYGKWLYELRGDRIFDIDGNPLGEVLTGGAPIPMQAGKPTDPPPESAGKAGAGTSHAPSYGSDCSGNSGHTAACGGEAAVFGRSDNKTALKNDVIRWLADEKRMKERKEQEIADAKARYYEYAAELETKLEKATSPYEFYGLINKFNLMGCYKDAKELLRKCEEKCRILRAMERERAEQAEREMRAKQKRCAVKAFLAELVIAGAVIYGVYDIVVLFHAESVIVHTALIYSDFAWYALCLLPCRMVISCLVIFRAVIFRVGSGLLTRILRKFGTLVMWCTPVFGAVGLIFSLTRLNDIWIPFAAMCLVILIVGVFANINLTKKMNCAGSLG